MGTKYQRQNGESMAAFRARCAAAEAAGKPAYTPGPKRYPRGYRRGAHKSDWERQADIVDGYNRDDLGESPDF